MNSSSKQTENDENSNTSKEHFKILKYLWKILQVIIPKLLTLSVMGVFIKLFFEKVIYSDGRDTTSFKNKDRVYSLVSGEFMKENHHGMITHKTPNRPYSLALSETEKREIAQQQQMEYYGHYVNPITGLPGFPDYITQEDRQLEELRRLDGTNRWMNQQ